MTAPSTVCPSCGEDVPFGRRTCEACGANVTAAAAPDEDTSDATPDAAEVADATSGPPTNDAGWDAPPPAEPDAVDVAAAPTPVEPVTTLNAPEVPASKVSAPAASAPAPFVPPVLREWNAGSSTPETGFEADHAAAHADPPGLAGAWLPPSSPTPRPSMPDSSAERAPADWPVAPAEPPFATPPDAARTPANAMPASLAAMLQPTPTGTPRWPRVDQTASDPEPVADAASGPSTAMVPPSRMPDLGPASRPSTAMVPPSRMPDLGPASRPSTALPPEPPRLEPGRSPLFADLPFDAPDTLPGWLVAGGGGLATISFLLPWIDRPDSYFSAWGLASISNLPVFLIVFGTTALAVLPSRLADWLRHGILGLTVGSFILGITWNRLVGATGGQLGVILEASGALLLLVGGILAIVRDRGAADGPRERG